MPTGWVAWDAAVGATELAAVAAVAAGSVGWASAAGRVVVGVGATLDAPAVEAAFETGAGVVAWRGKSAGWTAIFGSAAGSTRGAAPS
jgi:hypothetical protein